MTTAILTNQLCESFDFCQGILDVSGSDGPYLQICQLGFIRHAKKNYRYKHISELEISATKIVIQYIKKYNSALDLVQLLFIALKIATPSTLIYFHRNTYNLLNGIDIGKPKESKDEEYVQATTEELASYQSQLFKKISAYAVLSNFPSVQESYNDYINQSNQEIPYPENRLPNRIVCPAKFVDYIFYRLGNTHWKSDNIQQIIQKHSDRHRWRILEIGGGGGFVALDLISKLSNVDTITNIDPYNNLSRFTDIVKTYLGDNISKKYVHKVASALDFDYSTNNYDVIYAYASLFVMPKDCVRKLFTKWHDSLAAGGIIVIHENVKSDQYASHNFYDNLWSSQELDQVMADFGKIFYYNSFTCDPVPQSTTNGKTLYRVIKK